MEDASDRRVRRRDVAWEVESGRVVVHRVRGGPVRRVAMRLFGIAPVVTVRLDPLGSEVWHLLDGRTVGAVLEALRATHPNQDDLPQRLGRYLSSLASQGLVDLD